LVQFNKYMEFIQV